MNKKSLHRILFSFLLLLGLFVTAHVFVPVVHAQNVQAQALQQIEAGAKGADFATPIDPRIILSSIIKFILTLLGTVFFILMLLSGFWFITAHGEEDKVNKATVTAQRATVGLLIVLLAYAITAFVTTGAGRVYGTYNQPNQRQFEAWDKNVAAPAGRAFGSFVGGAVDVVAWPFRRGIEFFQNL